MEKIMFMWTGVLLMGSYIVTFIWNVLGESVYYLQVRVKVIISEWRPTWKTAKNISLISVALEMLTVWLYT